MGEDTPDTPSDEKGYKGYKLTAAEKRAQTRNDLQGWRKKLQLSKVKFDDVQKGIYLNVLRKTGRKGTAAQAAGVCVQTVADHCENDPDFAAARDDALQEFADFIHAHAIKLSVNGVKKPIVGGKDKDEIIAHETIYATNILAMEMRRTNPEYKERQEIDVNQTGSVLIAPAEMSPAEWIKQQAEKNKAKKEPGAGEK
jgi:hypothetical protein